MFSHRKEYVSEARLPKEYVRHQCQRVTKYFNLYTRLLALLTQTQQFHQLQRVNRLVFFSQTLSMMDYSNFELTVSIAFG